MSPMTAIQLFVVLFVAALFYATVHRVIGLWLQAKLMKAPVSFSELYAMGFRKSDSRIVVLSYIRAKRAGVEIPVRALESHDLSGGNVPSVVSALIAADKAGIPLTADEAFAMDLRGTDPLGVVNDAVMGTGGAGQTASRERI